MLLLDCPMEGRCHGVWWLIDLCFLGGKATTTPVGTEVAVWTPGSELERSWQRLDEVPEVFERGGKSYRNCRLRCRIKKMFGYMCSINHVGRQLGDVVPININFGMLWPVFDDIFQQSYTM